MKFHSQLLTKLGGLGLSTFIQNWMSTLDYRGIMYDQTVDPAHRDLRGPVIYLFWHEYIPMPLYLRSHCNLAVLLSRHRDAEWLSQAAYHLGFESIRGSTFRGGGRALRELARKCHEKSLVITPDGPRGPRRKLAQGPIYLSSKLGVPLVAMGFGYDRPWRMPTWDRFALPRPFSRARGVISPRIQIPPNLDRRGVEHYRLQVEQLLNRMTTEAETWAAAGTRKKNQIPIHRQPLLLRDRRYRIDLAEKDKHACHFPAAANQPRVTSPVEFEQ